MKGLRTTELVPLSSVLWVEIWRWVLAVTGKEGICVIAWYWKGSSGDSLENERPGVCGEEKKASDSNLAPPQLLGPNLGCRIQGILKATQGNPARIPVTKVFFYLVT